MTDANNPSIPAQAGIQSNKRLFECDVSLPPKRSVAGLKQVSLDG